MQDGKISVKKLVILFALLLLVIFVFYSPVKENLGTTLTNPPDYSPKKGNIKGLFLGDVMLDRDVEKKIESNGGEADYLLKKLEEKGFFDNKDLISANLEGAVTYKGKHYPPRKKYDFAFPVSYLKDLKKYQFNFFTTSNNHTLDQGKAGLEETREHLEKIGYEFVGCSDGLIKDQSSKIIEINGYDVGMLGISQVSIKLDEELLKEKIESLANSYDIVIANVHWGNEYEHIFNKEQRNLAHFLIDSGADIIIGHHTHVIQGIGIYKDRPIFYSLGNFIFDQYFYESTQESLAVDVELESGKARFNLIPTVSKESLVDLPDENKRGKMLKEIAEWSNLSSDPKENIRSGRFVLQISE